MFDRILFGKDEHGLVFYRFGMRSRPYPIDMAKAASLRAATIVMLVICGLMTMGGLFYAVALTGLILWSRNMYAVGYGTGARWLYLALVAQGLLIGGVVFIYDRIVGKILRGK